MSPLWGVLQRIRKYDNLADIGEIARRYFAMNAFDGVLMGNLTAGVDKPQIVVSTGLATCIAMGISGLWGAYLTEAAERKRDLVELSCYGFKTVVAGVVSILPSVAPLESCPVKTV